MALKSILFTFTAVQLLGGTLTLVAATAGSTFAIVRLATESHTSALQLQAAQLDTRVRELQAELQRRQLMAGYRQRAKAQGRNRVRSHRNSRLCCDLRKPRPRCRSS